MAACFVLYFCCVFALCSFMQCYHVLALMKQIELECGPISNVMAALSNIGGALCSTPQSLADAHY